MEWGSGNADLITVCHGNIADSARQDWWERLPDRVAAATRKEGLLRVSVFRNNYAEQEFVGFLEWKDAESLANSRAGASHTVEEEIFVTAKPYQLAAYDQFECRQLPLC